MSGTRTRITDWAGREGAAMAQSASKHTWVNPHAGKDCDTGYCQWCEGGLELCSSCGAFEGATTTECPKYDVAGELWDAVYAGLVDFRQGAWQLRPTRWIETREAWGAQPPVEPEPLTLLGLPPIGELGHHALFNPDTNTSWCLDSCPECSRVRVEAIAQTLKETFGQAGWR